MSKYNLEALAAEHEQTLAWADALAAKTKARYDAHPREIDSMSKSENLAHQMRGDVLRRQYMGPHGASGAVPDLERWQREKRSVAYCHSLMSDLREKYVAELLALPSLATERDRKLEGRFVMFTMAIRQIDGGVQRLDGHSMLASCLAEDLMERITPSWKGSRDPWDYTYGSLAATEARMAEVDARIDAAVARL
jgi:hypothetical protein